MFWDKKTEKFLRCFLLLELRVSFTIAVEIEGRYPSEEERNVLESESFSNFAVYLLKAAGYVKLHSWKSEGAKGTREWDIWQNPNGTWLTRAYDLCAYPFCLRASDFVSHCFYVQFDPPCYKIATFPAGNGHEEAALRYSGKKVDKTDFLCAIMDVITKR